MAAKLIHLNGTDEGITTATPSNIQEDFKKYVNDKMSLIEKSIKHLSSQELKYHLYWIKYWNIRIHIRSSL